MSVQGPAGDSAAWSTVRGSPLGVIVLPLERGLKIVTAKPFSGGSGKAQTWLMVRMKLYVLVSAE